MWKRKLKKNYKYKAKILVLIIILLGFLFFFVSKSGLFSIKQIEVEAKDLSCVTKEQLKNNSGILGQNFFLINSSKVTEDLKKKFVCIKSVNLEKFLPNKVKIQTSARQQVALLVNLKEKEASFSSLIENTATPPAEIIESSYLVDDEMVVFSKGSDELNLPKIYVYRARDNPKVEALQILEKVKNFGVNTGKNWIYDNFLLISQERMGPKIIFRLDKDIDIQLASLQLILDKAKIDAIRIEFIDLRFDKPVIQVAPKEHG